MALTGADRGAGSNFAITDSFTLSPNADFTTGSWAVLVVASDNAGSAGAAMEVFAVSDSLGNVWTRRTSPLYDPGPISGGVEGAIFTTAMNRGRLRAGTVITVSFSASPTAKAWVLHEIFPAAGFAVSYVQGGVNTGAATPTPTVTTGSLGAGNMLIGAGFAENVDSWVGDADAGWSAHQHIGVGSGLLGISVTSQRLLTPGAGAQTYNPTRVLSDCILSWIELAEVAAPSAVTPVAWPALADRVLMAATERMGIDVLYTPLSAPASPVTVRGVFDETPVNVQFDLAPDPFSIDSKAPRLGVRLANLPSGAAARGDTVVANGVTYRVARVLPDGHGGASLVLEKV